MTAPAESFRPVLDPRPNDSPWPPLVWPPGLEPLSGAVVDLVPCVPERDGGPLFDALNHDDVWHNLPAPRPKNAGESEAGLARMLAAGRFVWIVRLSRPVAHLAAGVVVGTSSYLDISPNDGGLEVGATAYCPAVWATRVNPDAKYLLLKCAFERLGAARVQLKTDVRNVRSQRAIASLGARYEGTLRRHMRRLDGTLRDTVLFSIVSEEWPAVRARLRARIDGSEENA